MNKPLFILLLLAFCVLPSCQSTKAKGDDIAPQTKVAQTEPSAPAVCRNGIVEEGEACEPSALDDKLECPFKNTPCRVCNQACEIELMDPPLVVEKRAAIEFFPESSVRFTRDQAGRVLSSEMVMGDLKTSEAYEYNDAGQITLEQKVDERGHTTTLKNVYEKGRLIKVMKAHSDGKFATLRLQTYHRAGESPPVTEEEKNAPDILRFQVDDKGNVKAIYEERKRSYRVFRWTYDDKGRLIRKWATGLEPEPISDETRYEYDVQGNLVYVFSQSQNREPYTRRVAYDDAGVATYVEADSSTGKHEVFFDDKGRVAYTHHTTKSKQHEYDATYAYIEEGERSTLWKQFKVPEALSSSRAFTIDERDKVVEIRKFQKGKQFRRETFTYDGTGQLLVHREMGQDDRLIGQFITERDASGRVVKSWKEDAGGVRSRLSEYRYDKWGNLIFESVFISPEVQRVSHLTHDEKLVEALLKSAAWAVPVKKDPVSTGRVRVNGFEIFTSEF